MPSLLWFEIQISCKLICISWGNAFHSAQVGKLLNRLTIEHTKRKLNGEMEQLLPRKKWNLQRVKMREILKKSQIHWSYKATNC